MKGPEFKEKRVRKVADLNKSMLGNKGEVATHLINRADKSFHLSIPMCVCRRWLRVRTGAT